MSQDEKTRETTRTTASPAPPRTQEQILQRLAPLVPGLQPENGVTLTSPGVVTKGLEHDWSNLISSKAERDKSKRKALATQIRAILDLNQRATDEKKSLAAVATEQTLVHRQAWEQGYVDLAKNNRVKEEALRSFAVFLSNMQTSRGKYRGRVYTIDASAEELTTETGLRHMEEHLKNYVDRPDPRESRTFLVMNGWPGSVERLHKLARVTHEQRCMLVGDAPWYSNLDMLRESARDGGLLDSIPGEGVHLRHSVLLGGRVRVRRRFCGKHAEEIQDVFVPSVALWFGMYLDNMAQGKPWLLPAGYGNKLLGADGVELPLRLGSHDHFHLYYDHRINPVIPLRHGSDDVVVWGAHALFKGGNGVQIGAAVVELLVVRYTEWVLNQVIFMPADEAKRIVRGKLSAFVGDNKGANRMFKDESRVDVVLSDDERTLIVDYTLKYNEAIEGAAMHMGKALNARRTAEAVEIRGRS